MPKFVSSKKATWGRNKSRKVEEKDFVCAVRLCC